MEHFGYAIGPPPRDGAADFARISAGLAFRYDWATEGLRPDDFAFRPGPEALWNTLNDPMSDALTHVGPINAWRRLSGNPSPRVNVFAGMPPEKE